MTSPIHATASVPTPWYRQATKVVAAVATTGAACVSIISFLYSFGVVGKSEAHQTIGNLGVAWVGVRPAVDTATAIGDTLHLAATITDRAGAVLVGTRPAWSSENPAVALVGNDGSVVAQGPGATMITVAVGGRVARSRIIVRQRVVSVDVIGADGTDAMTLRELDRQPLRARARDARGHAIADVAAQWRVDDSSIVVLDSVGIATARAPGRTIVTAAVDGVAGHAALSVVAAPATVALLSGAGQHATAGHALPQNVVVRVIGLRGLPVSGALVAFRVAQGDGVLDPASALSDADGRARTSWTLGGFPGSQSLIATVQHLDSTIVVTAEADPLPANTRAMAVVEHPSGPAALTLAGPIQLRITDTSGRVLPDVPVSWHALDGTVESLSPRTDSAGIARARWTLGPAAGTQRLRAQVGTARGGPAIPPVTFTATALAGAAARIVVLSGDRQRGTVAAPLRRPIVVRVLDAAGNGVADAALVVSVASGTLLDTLVRTDSTGSGALQWTLGRSAGSHTLGVHLDGLAKSLDIVAWAQPGAPANLDFDEVHGSPVRAGKRKLVATVTDLYGNRVPSARLTLTAKGGRVSPSRAVSDGRGAVPLTWTPGSGAEIIGAIAGTDVRETYTLHVGPAVLQAGGPVGPSAPAKVKARVRARAPRSER
ncbi:MAG TPA: Ig-like domain-containing protein [Gemmatimonadaceae bacterium]|nr:Ig-like domain-containing protein [Gemmatimonadaceae bacterium]